MSIGRILPLLALALSACGTTGPQDWPTPGTIAAPEGGVAGYQHGPEHSQFAVGEHPKQLEQYGYLKSVGAQGAFATKRTNGSTLAVPSAHAPSLRLSPFGGSSDDHDSFVKNYFVKLGLPGEQIGSVRGMTLLDAQGRAEEASRPFPRITAYYSRLERAVDGMPVAESFAWARVNSRGETVHEAVYWPSLPATVLTQARQFRQLIADPQRRRTFESRLPVSGRAGAVVIHHSSATMDPPFQSFASFDVVVSASPASSPHAPQPTTGASVTRHFDINAVECFLPQELLNLGKEHPATKTRAK